MTALFLFPVFWRSEKVVDLSYAKVKYGRDEYIGIYDAAAIIGCTTENIGVLCRKGTLREIRVDRRSRLVNLRDVKEHAKHSPGQDSLDGGRPRGGFKARNRAKNAGNN